VIHKMSAIGVARSQQKRACFLLGNLVISGSAFAS
jgi:hypothetical protein